MDVTKFFNSDTSVDALGRNGIMRCIGINLFSWGTKDAISIQPVNSRQSVGRCWIDIPLDFVDEFIEQIKRVQEDALKKKRRKNLKIK